MAAGYDPYSTGGSSYGIAPDLQFYNGGSASTSATGMHASTSTGMGSMSRIGGNATGQGVNADFYGAGPTGNMQSGGVGGVMLAQGGFWSAFTAAPLYENEAPLLEGEYAIAVLVYSRLLKQMIGRNRTRHQFRPHKEQNVDCPEST